ncbi:iron uptake transporter deferrochelatase/peroxidase subunit [Rothia sp. LK2588]|uniref:iron uptake transporter deferrochelatase/peroxidase subunit n=1 Tax=Rothia sp. LK2588 TaxID=3114369 RepID=UPI0034CD48F6
MKEFRLNRRTALLGGVGLATAATVSACADGHQESTGPSDIQEFHGEHQPGITTAVPDRMHFVALTVKATTREELQELFQDWTKAARQLMRGESVGQDSESYNMPPDDTGEAMGLSAANLTLTFGLGRSLFVDESGHDRFGLKDKLPPALTEVPKMRGDMLEENRSGGDLCIQACADDPQVAVHAVRNLVRIAAGRAVVAWSQLGFGRTSSTSKSQQTPRNLFGFKDGTANLKVEDGDLVNEHVWASEKNSQGNPTWMDGGSYCATRRIRMLIETWDRAPLKEQEQVVGRTKKEGAPLSGGGEFDAPDFHMQGRGGPIIPADSHVALMHPAQNEGKQMLRRGFNYTDGTDGLGHLDAGLFFIAFVCDPRTHFFPILQKMMKSDAMSEYLRHTGSALFAVPPGVKDENDYLASGLFTA